MFSYISWPRKWAKAGPSGPETPKMELYSTLQISVPLQYFTDLAESIFIC